MSLKPGSKQGEPTETEGGRKNPRPRRINPWQGADYVLNKREDHHYVLVNPADMDARAQYQFMGYERVKYSKGGPKPAGMIPLKEGEYIEVKGQWLMSISLAELEAFRAENLEHVVERTRAITRGRGEARSEMTDRKGMREYTQYAGNLQP